MDEQTEQTADHPGRQEKTQRNRRVYAERLKGRTFRAIANQFAVSTARIRDICEREERRASDLEES